MSRVESRSSLPIATYLQQHLAGRLAIHGLTDQQVAVVVDDVRCRLTSALSHWNDLGVRQVLLLPGREEATFYDPADVDLDVRSLVVVAIRNSLIECLSSTPEAAQQMGLADQTVFDRDIPTITNAAIRYFGSLCLSEVADSTAVNPRGDDLFGCLAARYPTAWRALSQVSRLTDSEGCYEPVIAKAPVIAVGRPAPEGWRVGKPAGQLVSGMERSIEPQLQRVLRLVTNGVVPIFFSDSFKMITRNPEKLFEVIEFVLCHDRAVVTQNYYLSNGQVAQRIPLLRPAHTVRQAREKFQDRTGLSDLHDLALRKIGAYV